MMMLAQVSDHNLMTDFHKMTSDERLEMFIQATDYLRQQGIYYKMMADAIGTNYKRIKNMRSQGGPEVRPTTEELEALFKAFPDRLAGFRQMLGEPSPEEQKLMSLEERIAALEAEDRLRVLQQQRAVLAKANQIADRAIKQKNLQQ